MDPMITSAAVSGGSSFLSSLMNNLFNISSQNKTNKLNYQMFKESQDFASQEAQKAFDRESGFAWDMFNAENAYNTPLAMLERLHEAGLSPFDYFSNGNYVGASGNSVSGNIAPSPVSHAMQAPSLDLNMNGAINSFAQVIQTLADSKYKNAQTERTLALYSAELEKMLSEKGYTDTLKANADFDRMVKEYKLPYEVNNLVAEYKRLLSQGDLNKALEYLHKMETSSVWENTKTTQQMRPYLVANARRLYDVYSSEINRNNAAAGESRAHAGLYGSEKHYQDLVNEIQEYTTAYERQVGTMKLNWIHQNKEKFVDSLDSAIESSNMSNWAKYQAHKRLNSYYADLNKDRENNAQRIFDDMLQYVTNDLGISLSGKVIP